MEVGPCDPRWGNRWTTGGFAAWIDPGAEPVDLRAGSIRASLDGVDLRSVRLEGGPLVDRVYVAVRDRDWDTIPAVVSDLDVRREGSAFSVSFDARHRARDIDFAWHGTITGDADGTIRSVLSGEARSTFEYSRIGFCVLHPDALAGSAYQAETPDGPVSGTLPLLIAPQTIVDGALQPLIPAFDALRLDAADGTRNPVHVHGRPLRDRGPAQLDRRIVQDVLHADRPRAPVSGRAGPAVRAERDDPSRRSGRRGPRECLVRTGDDHARPDDRAALASRGTGVGQ